MLLLAASRARPTLTFSPPTLYEKLHLPNTKEYRTRYEAFKSLASCKHLLTLGKIVSVLYSAPSLATTEHVINRDRVCDRVNTIKMTKSVREQMVKGSIPVSSACYAGKRDLRNSGHRTTLANAICGTADTGLHTSRTANDYFCPAGSAEAEQAATPTHAESGYNSALYSRMYWWYTGVRLLL